MVKITSLVDNTAGRCCVGEHGFSVLVEADEKVLFDVGASDTIIKNGVALRIPLHKIETIVLSHGHDDHSSGLKYFTGQKLITHPDAFKTRFRKRNKTALGLPFERDAIIDQFELVESANPYQISDQITFLGEIPRINNFEAQNTAFYDAKGEDDFVPDDSAIAIRSDKGLVIISGCAHAGICNTVEYAKQIMHEEKVYAVMGGFHLFDAGEVTQKTIDYLKNAGVSRVLPSHCTAFPAQVEFYKQFAGEQIKAGNSYIF